MSSLKITNLTCPGCNAEGEFKYYASVNVTLDPDLRDKIMDGSLFRGPAHPAERSSTCRIRSSITT